MKWLRFRRTDGAGGEGFGVLEGEEVQVHDGDLFGETRATGERLPLAALQWLTPCVPGKIIGLWNNFHAAAEKNGWARPAEPLYFLKAATSAAAHRQPIAVPAGYDGRVAYEGELALVIGKTARAVSVEAALSHVFGYCCANDVTAMELIARDPSFPQLIARDPSFPQWARAKSFDGFGAFGPVIETAFDVSAARLRTRVGGRERQNYALSDMIFGPAELVSRISHDMTLAPGDLILCGTSLGVLPMKPGTEVEVEIDGIGVLGNVYG
jgi:2-keto-4-pentenoate hydratase/2-oxohepta-3-ene-1,7-dioic acid hydratase in catechol pathway